MASTDSHSAAALHTRLQEATRAARLDVARPLPTAARRRRRPAAAAWNLLQFMQTERGNIERSREEMERAMRLVLSGLLASAGQNEMPCGLDGVTGPLLIVRSGPWPVLRALLDGLTPRQAGPISVVCHVRDAEPLARLSADTGLPLTPILYPRFEPFVTTTLRRLLQEGAWTAAFVLDASRHGRGLSLEHITSALDVPTTYVWNGSHAVYRLRPLRERLGRETYAVVRGLLRWHAARMEERP